jgi:hypothetical protein
MDLDIYKSRLSVTGSTTSESFENSSINLLNQNFDQSPYYCKIPIDGTITEVRMNSGDTSEDRTMLLRPKTVLNRGSYVVYSDYNWIITDTVYDDIIFPQAIMQRCNHSINVNGVDYPCIITGKETLRTFGINYGQVPILSGSFYAWVQYNSNTKNLKEQTRLSFNGRSYEVKGVDPVSYVINEVGYIMFMLQLVVGHTSDVIDNNNKSNPSGGDLW